MARRAAFVLFALFGALLSAPELSAKPTSAPKPATAPKAATAKPKPKPKSKAAIRIKKPAKPAKRAAPSKKPRRASMTDMPADSKAAAYAAMDASACLRELDQRGIPYVREKTAPGVKIPIRLAGAVGGVLYRTDFPDKQRPKVPWEVLDCRLALSLHDWSAILRGHGVYEVRMFSVWRPPSNWPAGVIAKRHPGGLAIDVRELKKESGPALVVEKDWNRKLGAPVCAEAGPPAATSAEELRTIICTTAEARIFHSMLTPNHDRSHFNHFHLELTADVSWFMLE